MQPFKDITQREWGGLNEDENPSSIGSGELSECLNVSLLGNSIGTRPGVNREGAGNDYADKITTATGNQIVKGIYHFSDAVNFKRDTLLVVAGQEIWINSTTSATIGVSVNIPASGLNIQSMAQYRGHVFLCGRTPNGLLTNMHAWDVNIANPIIGVPMTAVVGDPKYIIAKWGYLFVAGMNPTASGGGVNTASDNPMVVRFNDISGDPLLAAGWPTANTIGAGTIVGSVGGLKDWGGEFITGLNEYQDNIGDWLLILTSHRIISVLRSTSAPGMIVDSAIANGCVSHEAYVNLGLDYGDAVYMSRKGIHSLRQSQEFGAREDSFLSWKIRRTLEDLNENRIGYTVAGYDPTEGFVLFAIATGSSTFQDTILCLDVREKESLTAARAKWYIWKLGTPSSEKLNIMAQAPDPSGRIRLYVGTTDGSVGYFSRNEYSDFESGFSVSWTGKHEDFGAPMIEKTVGDIVVDVQPGGDYSPLMTTIFDFGSRQSPAHSLTMAAEGAKWEEPSGQTPSNVWANDAGTEGFRWASSAIVTDRQKLYGVGRGNTIAHRFQHGGIDQPFWIAGLTVQVAGDAETIGATGEGS